MGRKEPVPSPMRANPAAKKPEPPPPPPPPPPAEAEPKLRSKGEVFIRMRAGGLLHDAALLAYCWDLGDEEMFVIQARHAFRAVVLEVEKARRPKDTLEVAG